MKSWIYNIEWTTSINAMISGDLSLKSCVSRSWIEDIERYMIKFILDQVRPVAARSYLNGDFVFNQAIVLLEIRDLRMAGTILCQA